MKLLLLLAEKVTSWGVSKY